MELHISIAELVYLQNLLKVIESRQTLLEKVVAGYRAQYQTGNVTGNELLRLQTALFAVNGEMNEVRTEYNAHQKNIKNLLALEPSVVVIVAEEQVDFPSPLTLDPAMLMETALASRPDLAAAVLRAEYHRKDIVYQKALAIPDISLGVKYDRAGGVWDNFFGVGIGVQLPVFNRNKGAIRSARFRLRQNEILVLQERNNIRNEIIECLENYKAVYSFLEENGVNRSIQSEMDKMPDVYTKNLLMKNISMVEYMDFMDSYHASKEVLLRSRKELRLQFERLQFDNRTNYKITNDEENNLSFTTVAGKLRREQPEQSADPGNRFGRFLQEVLTAKAELKRLQKEFTLAGKVVVDSDRTISYSPLVSGVVVKSYFSLGDYAEKVKGW